MCCVRTLVLRPAAHHEASRSERSLGASQRPGAALAIFSERLVAKVVEVSRRHIVLELPVPQLGVELEKPTPERSELLTIQLADGSFEFLDLAHGHEPTTRQERRLQAAQRIAFQPRRREQDRLRLPGTRRAFVGCKRLLGCARVSLDLCGDVAHQMSHSMGDHCRLQAAPPIHPAK